MCMCVVFFSHLCKIDKCTFLCLSVSTIISPTPSPHTFIHSLSNLPTYTLLYDISNEVNNTRALIIYKNEGGVCCIE